MAVIVREVASDLRIDVAETLTGEVPCTTSSAIMTCHIQPTDNVVVANTPKMVAMMRLSRRRRRGCFGKGITDGAASPSIGKRALKCAAILAVRPDKNHEKRH
jgi:hypothetical protein